ncbi:tetratricopeptide repeat protein [Actinacidiphila alni]|uniref:tetratricopeptide repeat protein n=1 Tax=Actinacidiphila alni TaxID=380248 RepID=UPI0033E84C50
MAPRTPVQWPVRVGAVPRSADWFQHRDVLDTLDTALTGPGTAVVCQVLTGMGGVGKTQLAARRAHQAWRAGEIDLLVWVTASTRQAVIDAYADAAAKVLHVERDEPARAAQEFLAWLEPGPGAAAGHCRWLLVLDNVTDPADLTGLWPPDHPLGRTVVTTRSRDAALTGAGRRLVTVGLFTPREATGYLGQALAARGRAEGPEECVRLAEDLGRLPLALSQAAAYLIDADIGCREYRELLANRARLDDLRPPTLPDDQTAGVAAAWSLSVDRADARGPRGLARSLLELAALLDPNGIPQPVFTSAPVRDHLTRAVRAHASAGAWRTRRITAEETVRALRDLHGLNLVDHTPRTAHRAVRVHQLIQRAVRDGLGRAEHDALARTAADALAAVWPEVERDTDLAQALRANTAALSGKAETALHRPHAHALLYRVGESLGVAGQVAAAAGHFGTLARTTHQHLGPDHPDTLAARHDLAYWRGAAGDAQGAISAFRELFADRLRVLGPDHPHTLTTRGNIAYWIGEARYAGGAEGAATALEELLADRLRVLGPDHPDTLGTRHNIARLRGRAGQTAEAAEGLGALLADMVRVLGPDHPDTLTTRHDLAYWQGRAGDAEGAARAFEELLTDAARVLGPDHPDTLTTRHNIARLRGRAGDVQGARRAFEELLADRLRVLGPDHPHTLTTRHNIARLRGRQGDAAGAVRAFEELLTDMERVLGPEHNDTTITRHNIAYWREESEVVTLRVRRDPAG